MSLFYPPSKMTDFSGLQGNNNLIRSIIISAIILYGETRDEGWGG